MDTPTPTNEGRGRKRWLALPALAVAAIGAAVGLRKHRASKAPTPWWRRLAAPAGILAAAAAALGLRKRRRAKGAESEADAGSDLGGSTEL